MHALGKIHRGLADDIKFDIRMRLGKATDDFGHVAVGVIIRRADPQRAFKPIVVEGRHRLVVQADDAAGIV